MSYAYKSKLTTRKVSKYLCSRWVGWPQPLRHAVVGLEVCDLFLSARLASVPV